MGTLTITSKGQVTLRQDLLRHLGVAPGDRIELITLPGGRIELRAVRPSGSINGFIGKLAGPRVRSVTLEEMQEAASAGWSKQS
ncbi:MAG: AbrB/MazE/SpoVT family DNA-binding domain-containing protein [Synechococcus sp.]